MTHSVPEVLLPPADITLFAHQGEAIRSWAKAGGRGVLEMATGSGKTITGLSLASRLYDGADAGLAILIVAPPIHLVNQWREVVRIIGVEPGMTCASYTAETAPERRSQLLRDFSSGLIQVLVAIRCLDEGVDVPETRTAYILASSTNPRQFIQRRGRVLPWARGRCSMPRGLGRRRYPANPRLPNPTQDLYE